METISASLLSAVKAEDFESSFQMIDVGAKVATARTAFARGTIHLSKAAYLAIEDRTNPKGDVLALAEITAIQGAKNTSALLPLCHPLPIEKVRVRFEKHPENFSITVFTEVSTTGKTGVEMEALAAVNAGLLGIYDLSKVVDPVIEISGIRLDQKIGGKSGHWKHPGFVEADKPSIQKSEIDIQALAGVKSAVITLSDRCHRKEMEDRSGPAIKSFLNARGSAVIHQQILPDEIKGIQDAVMRVAYGFEGLPADFLVLTGGTGISPTDITPEALAPLWTKKIAGIGELLRASGAKHTAMSYLSRSEGGLIGKCFVVCLPGSVNAVKEGLAALEPMLTHLFSIKEGGTH
jgi:cyclic pyranopterin phosphate synthase